MPPVIDALLSSQSFGVIAVALLTSFFWINGVLALIRFGATVSAFRAIGLPRPVTIVAAMIVTQIGGSLLLLTDYRDLGWLGTGWLGVFTAATIPVAQPFWKFRDARRTEESQITLEHVTVIGGLTCAAILVTG